MTRPSTASARGGSSLGPTSPRGLSRSSGPIDSSSARCASGMRRFTSATMRATSTEAAFAPDRRAGSSARSFPRTAFASALPPWKTAFWSAYFRADSRGIANRTPSAYIKDGRVSMRPRETLWPEGATSTDVGSRGRPRSLRHGAGVTCAVWALAFSLLAVVSALPGPPTAILTVDDATPFVREPVRFDASSSVAHDMGNGAITAYRFDFGDGTGTEWQASPFADHSYSLSGVRNPPGILQQLRGIVGGGG